MTDVCWAPYSSSVLAASTATGRLVVWDLAVRRLDPLVSQAVTSRRKAGLNTLQFHPSQPVLLGQPAAPPTALTVPQWGTPPGPSTPSSSLPTSERRRNKYRKLPRKATNN